MSIAGNDLQSFEQVYQRSFPKLLKVAYHITLDRAAAEDICQEGFIRFYNRTLPFPNEQQALYWLIRVVKNLAFNYRKRKGREYQAVDRYKREPERKEAEADEPLLEEETKQLVRKALDLLPEKYKTVLVLKEYGELSYREIAKVLRISEGNVKVRVHRARTQLESLINEEDIHVRS